MQPIRFADYLLVDRVGDCATLRDDAGAGHRVTLWHTELFVESPHAGMLLDDARLHRVFVHPNVARMLGIAVVDREYLVATERFEGICLADVPAPAVRLAPVVVASIGVQACEGLHYIHEHRTARGEPLHAVHRDVRPEHVCVTSDGTVKVLALGLTWLAARNLRRKNVHRGTVSADGIARGRYAYVSPEVARGRPVDRRADVFSLGVVLWEALAGRRLFAQDDDLETLTAITRTDAPSLREATPHVSAALADVVMRALARDPDQRWPTARAFGEALRVAQPPLTRSALIAAVSG